MAPTSGLILRLPGWAPVDEIRNRATYADPEKAARKAGLDLAIDRGWLVLHESGTYVKFTQTGADMFA